jgi:hypothetical protein
MWSAMPWCGMVRQGWSFGAGWGNQLTPERSNGARAMIERIRADKARENPFLRAIDAASARGEGQGFDPNAGSGFPGTGLLADLSRSGFQLRDARSMPLQSFDEASAPTPRGA